MNIQVNTDHNIEGNEELNQYIESVLEKAFERFTTALTRIEVYLSDENGGKTSEKDKRCLLEARVSNHQPVVVSHHADSIHQAIDAASDKLLRALDKMVGKMTNHNGPKDLVADNIEVSEEE